MEYENDIYEEVDTIGNVYEVDAKTNSDAKKQTDGISKIKHPTMANKGKKRTKEILAIGTLLLLIAVVFAGTVYAVYEISKLKSQIASFNVTIAQLQTYMQDAIQQNSAENGQMNNSILVLNSIVGYLLTSCSPLTTSFSAAEYGFVSANGSYVHQSCPQETTRCGRRGRWRLLANLDMTNSTHQCYSNLTQHIYSNRRFCVRNSNTAGCSSVVLPTTAYRSVCGLVRAYQFGQPEAFHPSTSIDSPYVEGVSITHGSPRQHIWTFAVPTNERSGNNGCPCISGGNNSRPPFVGNNYFCDTGTSTGSGNVFYGADPLWDGAGCGPTNNCCSFNNPPWFYRELLHYTNDYVELRICSDFNRDDEDIAIERVEIYVN